MPIGWSIMSNSTFGRNEIDAWRNIPSGNCRRRNLFLTLFSRRTIEKIFYSFPVKDIIGLKRTVIYLINHGHWPYRDPNAFNDEMTFFFIIEIDRMVSNINFNKFQFNSLLNIMTYGWTHSKAIETFRGQWHTKTTRELEELYIIREYLSWITFEDL